MAENKQQLRFRLQSEGRWQEYLKEREALKKEGMNSTQARNALAEKYAPLEESGGETSQDGGKLPQSKDPRVKFKNVLPNGMPIVDGDIWKGKPQTDIVQEFNWVHENLGVKGITESDAPSASAWRMYFSARYSISGFADFQKLYKDLVVPDKAALRDRNKRKDDGSNLNMLDELLAHVIKQREENSDEE